MLCGNKNTFKADSVTLGTNRQLLLAQIVGYIRQARSKPLDLMRRDLDKKDNRGLPDLRTHGSTRIT
jgi:hypothetical protein